MKASNWLRPKSTLSPPLSEQVVFNQSMGWHVGFDRNFPKNGVDRTSLNLHG